MLFRSLPWQRYLTYLNPSRMNAQKQRLYDDVKFLTEIRPYRNHLNLEVLETVAAKIRSVFITSGLEVRDQQWKANGNTYTNVIGVYNPGQPRTLVVGAHYDVCGNQPGADDNASAVAGLLETARLLGEHSPAIDYTIELVGYCLEEPPYFGTNDMGSYIHARSLSDSKVDVIGMICYEMIGYYSEAPFSQPFPSEEFASRYPQTANFIMTVGIETYDHFNKKVCRLMAEASAVEVHNISFPIDNHYSSLAGLSDHHKIGRAHV